MEEKKHQHHKTLFILLGNFFVSSGPHNVALYIVSIFFDTVKSGFFVILKYIFHSRLGKRKTKYLQNRVVHTYYRRDISNDFNRLSTYIYIVLSIINLFSLYI